MVDAGCDDDRTAWGGRNIWRRTEGTTVIEFAIVAPVLMMFIIGCVAYGMYFAVAHNVQQLTAEAARATVAGIDVSERQLLARQTIDNTVGSYALLRSDRLTVNVGAMSADSNFYKVTTRYDASHLGIWALDGIVPLPSATIQRESVVRRGGF
jgi:Flp pilus assembly protein TadG